MSKLQARCQKHIESIVEGYRKQRYTARIQEIWDVKDAPSNLLFYIGIAGVAIVWLVFTLIVRQHAQRRRQTARPDTPNLEKRSIERQPGVWPPSSFRRPRANPYPSWSLETSKPLPYRPFRYGPKYNITMGLRSMQWDDWIELDNDYMKYHSIKAARIAERGEKCSKTAPEAWNAAVELLEELCAYLPERYPTMFKRLEGQRQGVMNLATGETIDIKNRLEKEDPMQTCARLVQDDLAIMIERPDGNYYLLAGTILLAGFWRLEDKFGMPLSEIHTSGDVPQYKEKLEKGMHNMFKRLQPDKPVLRNNYFLQVDGNLAWCESLGSEDKEGINWASAPNIDGIENVHFRCERQSLRRLPRSGGVAFTIRTYFLPLSDICQEPYVPGRLASAMRSWGDDVSHYKGKAHYAEVVLRYLDATHQKQIENGLDLEKEDDVRVYPY